MGMHAYTLDWIRLLGWFGFQIKEEESGEDEDGLVSRLDLALRALCCTRTVTF